RTGPGKTVVTKEDFAYAVAACDLDPNTIVSKGKELIFEDRLYKRIFASKDPLYYLTRYWLMRTVKGLAKGRGKYAKWLVLNFTWRSLSPGLNSGSSRAAFVNLMERGGSGAKHFRSAVRSVYREALRFYRL